VSSTESEETSYVGNVLFLWGMFFASTLAAVVTDALLGLPTPFDYLSMLTVGSATFVGLLLLYDRLYSTTDGVDEK
jgi:hypothetical protein